MNNGCPDQDRQAGRLRALIAVAVALGASLAGCGPGSNATVIGIHHQKGCYSFTDIDFLSEGSGYVLELGARAIGVYMGPEYETYYPGVEPGAGSLKELADTGEYKRLFERFDVISITCYAFAGGLDRKWQDGIASYDAFDEHEEIRRLAEHLLREYSGSGKAFILKNWEGDWMLLGGYSPDAEPGEEALRAMERWLGERIAAVSAARAAVPQAEDVEVYSAVEFNLVEKAMAGRATVLTRIVPRLRADLYSLSAWDCMARPDRIELQLDFVAGLCPPSTSFGENNVFIGEFGCPRERPRASETIELMLNAFRRRGLPYCFFWQIIDNECNGRALWPGSDEQRAALQCRGFGLIDRNGRRTEQWALVERHIRETGRSAVRTSHPAECKTAY